MKRLILSLLILASVVSAAAQSPPASISLMGVSTDRGNFTFSVSKDRLLATPSWTGWPSEPPLSVEDARGIAMRLMQKLGIKEPDLCSAEWASQREVKDRWYYIFSFDPNTDKRFLSEPIDPVIVLMDGSIVEPTRANR